MAVRVTVVKARGLERADCLWSSHTEAAPFCTLKLLPDGPKKHTQVCKHTASPVRVTHSCFDPSGQCCHSSER